MKSSFSKWVKNRMFAEAKKKPQPVQMPKEDSTKIEVPKVKERKSGGRKNTTMDTTPKRTRTRGDASRKSIEDSN